MAVSSTSTKAVILKAYQAALADIKQRDAEIRKLKSQVNDATPTPSSPAASPGASAPSGGPRTVEAVVSNLNTLAASFGGASNALSATLTTEATRLADLLSNENSLREELSSLHGIEVGEGSLDALIKALEDKIASFEEAQNTKRVAFEEEQNEKRNGWKKERDERSAQIKERDEQLRKSRKRESDEFKYDLSLSRKLEEEQHNLEQKALQDGLDAEREASAKAIKEREDGLSEREKAAAEARDKVEKLPKELEAAVKRAREEGAAIARRQSKIKTDMLDKDHEGRRRVYELRISTMETTISKQANQIESLTQQLNAALKQAQDLAVKAIEGASNATSFDAMREIAMEQAKNPQKK